MPRKLKRQGPIEPHHGGPPKAQPLLIVAMTVKTYEGDRLVEKRLRYREKLGEGLWREFDQTVTMEPEKIVSKGA